MVYDIEFLVVSLQKKCQAPALAAAAFPDPTPMDAAGLCLLSLRMPNYTKYNKHFYPAMLITRNIWTEPKLNEK